MKFTDPDLTEQALNTHLQEVEVLYWVLEDALYAGNHKRANSLLTIMLYMAKYRSDLIYKGLRPVYRQSLKEICHQLLGTGPIRKESSVKIKPAIHSHNIPFKLEYELKDFLVNNKSVLEKVVGEAVKITGTEVETEEDYRCDIVAESAENFYPIELKIAQANHAVVSQCSKYCFYFYRKLRYGRFKNIQGIVIANGYCSWSINELRKAGHWIFSMLPDDKGIALSKITND